MAEVGAADGGDAAAAIGVKVVVVCRGSAGGLLLIGC